MSLSYNACRLPLYVLCLFLRVHEVAFCQLTSEQGFYFEAFLLHTSLDPRREENDSLGVNKCQTDAVQGETMAMLSLHSQWLSTTMSHVSLL